MYKSNWELGVPKVVPYELGERDTARKQAVAVRHAESRPPLWQFFCMTLMECG